MRYLVQMLRALLELVEIRDFSCETIINVVIYRGK